MINYTILIIDCIYFLFASLQYFIAPRIGPNPYFGFRTGYTFSDTLVWKRTNRFIGKLMIIHSILLLPFVFTDLLIYFLLLLTLPLVTFIPVGVKYASYLLEMRGGKIGTGNMPIEEISVGKFLLLTPLLIYLALLILELIYYYQLPPTVAVHFDRYGVPNGWEDKLSFTIYFSLISLIYPSLSYLFIYLGRKYPLFLHPGRMRFKRDAILKFSIIVMDSVGILLIYVYLSIAAYAMYGIPPNTYILIFLSILIIILPITWLMTKGRYKNVS